MEICDAVVSEVSHRGSASRWRLRGLCVESASAPKSSDRTHLLLGVGPSWDLNDHVQDSLLLIGVEWDIVERGDWLAVALDEDAVLQGVWGADLADGILRSHDCGSSSSGGTG